MLHFSNPQLSAPALHSFQGINARNWCQIIVQPSPNLSLISPHFFLPSLFLSCLSICLLSLCWKDFSFGQLPSFSFFFNVVFTCFPSQNCLYSCLFPQSCSPRLSGTTRTRSQWMLVPPARCQDNFPHQWHTQVVHQEKILHWEGSQALQQTPQGGNGPSCQNSRSVWTVLLDTGFGFCVVLCEARSRTR